MRTVEGECDGRGKGRSNSEIKAHTKWIGIGEKWGELGGGEEMAREVQGKKEKGGAKMKGATNGRGGRECSAVSC